MNVTHTVVVGGGIIGISTAYALAKRGHLVTLVERSEIGAGASSGNAGIIAYGHPPLPRPGLVGQVLRWMLDGSSPLYLPPRLDPSLLAWLWRFRRACTAEHFAYCMNVLAQLGRLSKRCFEEIVAEEGFDASYHSTGWREVFRTERGFDHGRRDSEPLLEHGFDVEVYDGDELLRRDPAFLDGVVGAIQYRESAFTDPMSFLTALTKLAETYGAVIRTNTDVVEILETAGGVGGVGGVRLASGEQIESDFVVLAGGIWTTSLAARHGLHIPMQAGKGYHRNLSRPETCPNTAAVLAEEHVAVTPMGETLRLAGTVEFSGINHRLLPKRLDMLTNAARRYLRGISGTRTISEWCGLRPCTADGLPVIGWSPRHRGLFIATGHARMGLTLGPGTGRLVATCLEGEEPEIDLRPMRVDRFERSVAVSTGGPA